MRTRVWQCGSKGRSEHTRCKACAFEPGIEIVTTHVPSNATQKRAAHKATY